MTKTIKIGFIGAGNMNSAIIGGLLSADYRPNQLIASDPNSDKLANLNMSLGIQVSQKNADVASKSDVLILGVKPNYVSQVCEEVATVAKDCLIVSVAAGIQVKQISAILGQEQPIIRVMPNTPCLIQKGAIGLYANDSVSSEQRDLVSGLFKTTGEIEWINDESQMDLVTALSGSGPAYFFYFAEAMIEAVIELGMSKKQATNLVYQTMTGSAAMLKSSDKDASELRTAVTSPGGTTAAALSSMREDEFKKSIRKAIEAAYLRGQELSKDN